MAKTKPEQVTPSTRDNRRARMASFEAARKKEQRRRTVGLLVICLVLAMGLLAYPVYLFVQDSQARSATLADIGVAADAAGCDAPSENPATGNQDHVSAGTKVDYAETPPDTGSHYDTPAPFTKRFYTTDDRPAVETLVHNLEHGYTIAWYRADAPPEVARDLEAASKTFTGSNYEPEDKFIAAPWAAADGAGFPDGKNVVLARWTANPDRPSDQAQQRGVRQACAAVSGQAITDFMAKYPATSSPEPNGA